MIHDITEIQRCTQFFIYHKIFCSTPQKNIVGKYNIDSTTGVSLYGIIPGCCNHLLSSIWQMKSFGFGSLLLAWKLFFSRTLVRSWYQMLWRVKMMAPPWSVLCIHNSLVECTPSPRICKCAGKITRSTRGINKDRNRIKLLKTNVYTRAWIAGLRTVEQYKYSFTQIKTSWFSVS